MPDTFDIQAAGPGEESLQVILGALGQDNINLRWPSPEPMGLDAPEASIAPVAPEASIAPVAPEPKGMDAADVAGLSDERLRWAQALELPPVSETPLEATIDIAEAPINAVLAPAADEGPGATAEEAALRTPRRGVRPVQIIKRHPGSAVLAAGALAALAGGAVLGGWAKPVSVSLPGTRTILVDPSAHSASRLPTPPSSSARPSPSTTSAPPPSSQTSTSTPPPGAGPAPNVPSSTPASSDSSQSSMTGSSSTAPSVGTSSTGSGSDTSGSGNGTTAPPSSPGAPSSTGPTGGGTAPSSPPATPPPPPSSSPGSGGLAGVLSGVFGSIFGSGSN